MKLNTGFMAETFLDALVGVPVTLQLTLVTLLISIPVGFFMALGRLGKGKQGRLIGVYVSFIRSTPIVVQILFLYSLLPSLLNYLIKSVFLLDFNIFQVDNRLYAYIVFH